MEIIRDPLSIVYEGLKAKIKEIHGQDFYVTDGTPPTSEYRKRLPAANISYVSGTAEKAFMREYEPHALIDNQDGTYTAIYEIMRFFYVLQVSFFADMSGDAQQLSLKFLTDLENSNSLPLPDELDSDANIFLQSPPLPPRGEEYLYQVDQTWACSGKLLQERVVNEIDVEKMNLKVKNMYDGGR